MYVLRYGTGPDGKLHRLVVDDSERHDPPGEVALPGTSSHFPPNSAGPDDLGADGSPVLQIARTPNGILYTGGLPAPVKLS